MDKKTERKKNVLHKKYFLFSVPNRNFVRERFFLWRLAAIFLFYFDSDVEHWVSLMLRKLCSGDVKALKC